MTTGVSDSRFAMYEGLIALAWADGQLAHDEEVVLRSVIDSHVVLSDDQRKTLHDAVRRRVKLSAIWPQITDPQDRAQFLDYADMIIRADGTVDEREDAVYTAKLAKHLGSIDAQAITHDLAEFRADLIEADAEQAAADRAYAAQYGLIGFLKRLFRRDAPEQAYRETA